MINPLKISLSVLVLAPALLNAQTILIDFNGDDTPITTGQPETWNNPVNPGLDGTSFPYQLVADLADSAGAATGITLSITDGFHGRNSAGDDSGAVFPGTATEDSFYTANDTWDPSGGTLDNGFGILEFTGLDPSKTYDFTVYASRIGGTDNRESEYAFDGLNSSTVYLDAAGNISSTVTASGLSPTAGGIITLTVTAGPNNTTSQGFAYLGAIEMAVIPEPSSMALLVGAMATGFVMWRRRR